MHRTKLFPEESVNTHIQLVSMGLAATTALTAGFFALSLRRKAESLFASVGGGMVPARVALFAHGYLRPLLGASAWLLALNGWLIAAAGSGLPLVRSGSTCRRLRGSLFWDRGGVGSLCGPSLIAFIRSCARQTIGTAALFLSVASVFYLEWPPKTEHCGPADGFGVSAWAPFPVLGDLSLVRWEPRRRYDLTAARELRLNSLPPS